MEITKNIQIIDIGNKNFAIRIYDVIEDRFRRVMVLNDKKICQVLSSIDKYFFIKTNEYHNDKKSSTYVIHPDLSCSLIVETVCNGENCLCSDEKPYLASIWKDDKENFFVYQRYKKAKDEVSSPYTIQKIEKKDFVIKENSLVVFENSFRRYKDDA